MEIEEIEPSVSDANDKGKASMVTYTASATTTAGPSVNRTVVGFGAVEGGNVSVNGGASLTIGSLTVNNGPVNVQNSQTDHGMGRKKTSQEKVPPTIKAYESFKSREQLMDDVMDALVDPHIDMIGVHGMPGIGKTMFARKVMQQAMVRKLFDDVVMVTVSQNQDFRNIQEQISDMLDFKLTKETLEGRAVQIHNMLTGKKILLILDDIWDELDLEKLGIPSIGHQSGFKILITSRFTDVLSNKMKTDKNIEIGLLSKDESWEFFKKIVGETITKAPMDEVVRDVVNECARLPIALAIVANMLKDKKEAIWRNALVGLKNPTEKALPDLNKKVYHSIRLSYDFLQEAARSFFLLCSVFPEDYDIDIEELFIYGKGMGLLLSNSTLVEGRDEVVTLVHDLKTACLLLESEQDVGLVKMHDVVRDVAKVIIASKDKGMSLLSHGYGLTEWPARDTRGSYTAVYMDCGNFRKDLPTKLILPDLEILIVRQSYRNIAVSDTFLEDTKELKVLHLENMSISSQTRLFDSLKNLQTLRLQKCRLVDVSIVGELKNLEILSFQGSGIEVLSSVLSKLEQLKMLDLTDCYRLKVIQPNLISSLSNLEELYLRNSFVGWEGEGINSEGKNASLSELIGLPLTTLYICIPDANILPKYLFSRELNEYRIVIGRKRFLAKSTNGIHRVLKVKGNLSMFSEDGIKLLLKNSKELWLEEMEGLENVLSKLGRNTSLRTLYIETCDVAINTVVTPSSFQERLRPLFDEQVALPSLETLEILKTNKFEILWQKQHLTDSFSMLREIKIIGCNNLKTVFPSDSWRVLQHLEKLVIKQCELLEEISDPFEGEERAGDVIFIKLKHLELEDLPKIKTVWSREEGLEATTIHFVFPELTFFSLEKLPCLEALCAGIHTSEWLSLDKLVVDGCGKLNSFGSEISTIPSSGKDYLDIQDNLALFLMKKVVFPCLRHLTVSSNVIIKDLEHGRFSKEWFPELRVFKLKGSSNDYNPITTCLSTVIFGEIHTVVESLEVRSAFLEEIWPFEELTINGDQANRTEIFPCLEALTLYDSPRLVHLSKDYSHKMTVFQKIASLYVEKCGILNALLPSSGSFRNLEFLTIIECNELTYLFNSSTAKSLVKLEGVFVSKCEKIKSLVCAEEEEEEEKKIVWLNQLEIISLDNLPSLTSLHSENCDVQFTSLKVINMQECNVLTHLFNSSTAQSLVKMEVMNISKCEKFKSLVCVEEDEEEENEKKIMCNIPLMVMNLDNLPNLGSLPSEDKTFQFSTLEVINLNLCNELTNLFSSSTHEILLNLGETNISECKNMKTLVLAKEDKFVGLPNLTSLHLTNCKFQHMNLGDSPNLTSLHLTNCQFQHMNLGDSPDLTSLHLTNCQFQHMNLDDLPNLTSLLLQNCQYQVMNLDDLPNLTSLLLQNCQYQVMNLDELPNLTSLLLQNCQYQVMNLDDLPNLTSLLLENCQFQQMDLGDVPNLTGMHLTNCRFNHMNLGDVPNLTGMDLTNCQYQVMNPDDLPNLTSLLLENCQFQHMNLGDDVPNLTGMHLTNCRFNHMNLYHVPSLHLEEQITQDLQEVQPDIAEEMQEDQPDIAEDDEAGGKPKSSSMFNLLGTIILFLVATAATARYFSCKRNRGTDKAKGRSDG